MSDQKCGAFAALLFVGTVLGAASTVLTLGGVALIAIRSRRSGSDLADLREAHNALQQDVDRLMEELPDGDGSDRPA